MIDIDVGTESDRERYTVMREGWRKMKLNEGYWVY